MGGSEPWSVRRLALRPALRSVHMKTMNTQRSLLMSLLVAALVNFFGSRVLPPLLVHHAPLCYAFRFLIAVAGEGH
jgi:hypothetical protein